MKVKAHLCIVLIVCMNLTHADTVTTQATPSRYTFSWPLGEDALKPRGGMTRGAPVVLDSTPSTAWQSLQEKDLAPLERDRRAILAMAGTYRVTFDFLEVATYGANKPIAPYQSWGTEKIYVDRDSDRVISLVHVLEMRVRDEQGKVSEPIVTKHWRQDWAYEPAAIIEYRGGDRWERRKVDDKNVKGWWSQTVYQVDESPRYASLGRWEHNGSFSTWLSAETWRPLPRREWSVRDDYQVLIGTNRHTIHPTGWTQEENNLKAVLTAARQLDATQPYRGREYGFARYERIKDFDFAAADEYYKKTKTFWDQVRSRWDEVFAQRGQASLRGPVDKLGLFHPLFAQADAITEDASLAKHNEHVIDEALKAMGAL